MVRIEAGKFVEKSRKTETGEHRIRIGGKRWSGRGIGGRNTQTKGQENTSKERSEGGREGGEEGKEGKGPYRSYVSMVSASFLLSCWTQYSFNAFRRVRRFSSEGWGRGGRNRERE
jgi:hypothetical protein